MNFSLSLSHSFIFSLVRCFKVFKPIKWHSFFCDPSFAFLSFVFLFLTIEINKKQFIFHVDSLFLGSYLARWRRYVAPPIRALRVLPAIVSYSLSREREREREIKVPIKVECSNGLEVHFLCICTCIYIHLIFEREKNKNTWIYVFLFLRNNNTRWNIVFQ